MLQLCKNKNINCHQFTKYTNIYKCPEIIQVLCDTGHHSKSSSFVTWRSDCRSDNFFSKIQQSHGTLLPSRLWWLPSDRQRKLKGTQRYQECKVLTWNIMVMYIQMTAVMYCSYHQHLRWLVRFSSHPLFSWDYASVVSTLAQGSSLPPQVSEWAWPYQTAFSLSGSLLHLNVRKDPNTYTRSQSKLSVKKYLWNGWYLAAP